MNSDDWFPIRLLFRDGRWIVDLARLGEEHFREPFFHDTVARCLRRPFNLAFRRQVPLEAFVLEAQTAAGPHPAGLIFHLSRCGSTLLSQAFAALPGGLAISEAGPIDEAVRADRFDPRADTTWKIAALRALVAAYARFCPRDGTFVVKLDAWHARALPLFARAFPDVPQIFVYRNPVEILVSHERQFAWMMAALNAPTLLRISVADAMVLDRHSYRAQVLARICDAVLRDASGGDLLLHYDELPDAIWERVAPHFGVTLSPERVALMREVASRDAKRPTLPFIADGEGKRAEADEALAQAAQRFTMTAYRELERRRLAQRAKSVGAA
jgi:hypothetical protein